MAIISSINRKLLFITGTVFIILPTKLGQKTEIILDQLSPTNAQKKGKVNIESQKICAILQFGGDEIIGFDTTLIERAYLELKDCKHK